MRASTLDRLVLLAFIVVAVLLYTSTASYTGIAQTTSARYVRFLALAFGGLSALQLIGSLRSGWHPRWDGPIDIFGRLDRFVMVVGALIGFALAFEPLGFFVSAALFLPLLALGLGYRNILAVALTTIGVLGAVWLLFVKLLAVNLPGLG